MPRPKRIRPVSETELKNILAKNIRNALAELHMSQAQLANLLRVDRSMVSRWLKGDHAPNFESLARISNELGFRPRDLFTRRRSKAM